MNGLESRLNLKDSNGLGQVFLEVDTPDVEGFFENWDKYVVGGFDFCGLGIQGIATEVILIKDEEGQKTQVFLKVESPNPQKFASE